MTLSLTLPSKALWTRGETLSEDSGGCKSWSLWQFQKGKYLLFCVENHLYNFFCSQEGKFYEGDCYLHFDKNPNEQHVSFSFLLGRNLTKWNIVWFTKTILSNIINFAWNQVHFWIGGECSVDEQAVAAIKVRPKSFLAFWPALNKRPLSEDANCLILNSYSYSIFYLLWAQAVELDNLFGGLPIQHREVQGFESVCFHSVRNNRKNQLSTCRNGSRISFRMGWWSRREGWSQGLRKQKQMLTRQSFSKLLAGWDPSWPR